MESPHIAFGAFVLDTERKTLLKDGNSVPLGHRGVVLLAALLETGGRIVSKAELMDLAWPLQAVEESNLSVQIAALRKMLGPRPDGKDWIVTIPRVGYQFAPYGEKTPAASTSPAIVKSDRRPTVAVLPFTNLSSSQDQSYFADGMAEDIITALSRINHFLVLSRSTSFALKGRAMTARQLAEECNVRYILEGSIRTVANQMRISAQLTDAQSGNSIWADRYDVSADNIFDVQDDITRKIAQALQVTLTQGESTRLWEGQTRNLKAWELAVLGNRAFHRYSTADNALAQGYFEAAVEIDPEFTGALALLGISYYWDARYSVSISRPEALARAETISTRLQKQAPDLPQLCTLNATIALVQQRHDDSVKWGMLATQRSPSDSRAHGFLGMMQLYDGQLEQALASMKLAMRHSPYPEVYLYYYQAIIHMWTGQLDQALNHAVENEWLEFEESYSAAYLAAVYSMRGEFDSARQSIARLQNANPAFGLHNIKHSELYRHESRVQKLLELLAGAGLRA